MLGNVFAYDTSAAVILRTPLAAEDSFAAILARAILGMAIAAMIRMIATTISSSISEKPFWPRIYFLAPERRVRPAMDLTCILRAIVHAGNFPSKFLFHQQFPSPHQARIDVLRTIDEKCQTECRTLTGFGAKAKTKRAPDLSDALSCLGFPELKVIT